MKVQAESGERNGGADAGNDQQILPAKGVHQQNGGGTGDNRGETQRHHHDRRRDAHPGIEDDDLRIRAHRVVRARVDEDV